MCKQLVHCADALQPSGPIESTNCQYEFVENLNSELFPALHGLMEHPFFRFYKVDLYRECPFWQENGFCMNRACGVEEAKEVGMVVWWSLGRGARVVPPQP